MDTEQNINRGYTLIELLITIVLTTIIFAVVGLCLAKPLQTYADIARRANLIAIADLALNRIERDIHQALPNSIRVKTSNGKQSIEMVNVVMGMRYRTLAAGAINNVLEFNNSATNFNVYSQFSAGLTASSTHRVAIYNIGQTGVSTDDPIDGANVYAAANAAGPNPPSGTHIITPAATVVTLSNSGAEGNIALNPGFQFAFASPQQRAYLIDTPINYVCDPVTATLTRVHGYPITAAQPINLSIAPLQTAQANLIANHISSCTFTYQSGTSQRSGIITISLTVADGADQTTLLQQIQVSNVP